MNKRFTNDFKLKVYQSELLKEERYISSSFYYHARDKAIPKHVIPYELALDLHEYYAKLFSLEYQCANLINRAMRKKSRRIKLWALK